MSSLTIALSALQAHQQSMLVTSQNIANAGTAGYSTQRAALTAKTMSNGGGVSATAITSNRDAALDARILSATSASSCLTETATTLSNLESILGSVDGTNLQTQMEEVASAFRDLAENPDDDAIAESAVGSLSALVALLNQAAQGIADVTATVESDAMSGVEQANAIMSELASLNGSIVTSGQSESSEYADKQAQLLEQLAGLMEITARWLDDGTVEVSCNGNGLVAGSQFQELAMTTSVQSGLHLVTADTGIRINNTSGKLGACQDLVNDLLPAFSAQLDDIALSIIDYLGTQQSIGSDGGDGSTEMVSATTFSASQITENIDAIEYDSLRNLGYPTSLAPDLSDSGTSSVMCLNCYDASTGLADTYVLTYDAGGGPVAATRSIQDIVDAINTGSGGGFSLVPPASGTLQASLLASSGGYKLVIESTDGRTIDCGTAINMRPSDTAPAGQWVASDAGFTISGSYDGGAPYDAANSMTIKVTHPGTIGDDSDPPTIEVSIPVETQGVVSMKTTTITLDATHPSGVPIALSNGLEITFTAGSLSVSADPLTVITDASDDRCGLLGALGIDRVLVGNGAADIRIADEIIDNPSRIATGSARVAGANDIANAMADFITSAADPTSGTMAGTAYQSLVSNLGQAVSNAESNGEIQTLVLTTLDNQRQILIGVDVDEQMTLLIEQQQAYTAAAQVITMVRENIATLMTILR